MNRADWLKERRRLIEERMDRLFAPTYDEDWGTEISPTHQRFLDRFLASCSSRAHILDAPCGTGKYSPVFLAAGRSILGIDQSQGVLDRANSKFPHVPTQKLGLQEMAFDAEFDGAICMDAMEYVFPEDWLTVLGNFHRALKPGASFYFTVELPDEEEMREAVPAARALGIPVVEGEYALDGAYHYYPPLPQIRVWLQEAGFHLLEEDVGDEYRHFLVRSLA
jgi:SAM-dependent methyltransferase